MSNSEISGRRQVGNILCDPCKDEDEEKNVVCYCTVCNEYLCSSCTKAHRRATLLKHHHLLDQDCMPEQKLSSMESMCTKHDGKIVEYYCKIHEDCCCSVCAILEHKQCKVEYIDEIAIEFDMSIEYKSLVSVITDLSQLLQSTKKKALTNKDDVGHIHMKFVSEVKRFRSEINQILDSLEQKTLKDAQTVRDKDNSSTESASTMCDVMITDLEEMSSKMETQKKYKQQRQLVISAKKAQSQIKQYNNLSEDLKKTCTIREYTFRSNETILQSIKQVNSLGKFDDSKKEERRFQIGRKSKKSTVLKKSVSLRYMYVGEINIRHSTDTNEYGCYVTGGVMLDNNMLALADYYNGCVKTVDVYKTKVTSCIQLSTWPRYITCLERNLIVVTCDNQLVFIKVGKTLSVVKEVDMKDQCYGIVYTNSTLIVSFQRLGCVKVIDLDGHVLQTIKADKSGQQLFNAPCNIALSTDQETLYVSDEGNSSVTSMNLDGTVQHVYEHEKLERPRGLIVDREDNIYIAGFVSNNIHIISPQGTTIHVVQYQTPGMISPQAVIYCERYNRLYISHREGPGNPTGNTVSIYQIK